MIHDVHTTSYKYLPTAPTLPFVTAAVDPDGSLKNWLFISSLQFLSKENIWSTRKMTFTDLISDIDPMALLGKALGVLIIVGSLLNKAPLFINILKSKSVAGMSSSSIYSEAIMYSNAAFYCIRSGNPFTSYGETLLIAMQTVFVILLMWKYKVEPPISNKERSIVTAAGVLYLSIVYLLPQDKIYLLVSCNMPVTSKFFDEWIISYHGVLVFDYFDWFISYAYNLEIIHLSDPSHIRNLNYNAIPYTVSTIVIALESASFFKRITDLLLLQREAHRSSIHCHCHYEFHWICD